MSKTRLAAGTTAALSLAALMALGTAGVASAHVGVSGTSDAAGSSTVLTFSASHGCEGSPTTAFAIQIPESISAATPTANPNWTVEKVMEQLAEPITDSHGNEVTERVAEIVYTAKEPLADGIRDAFQVSVTLPEDAAGETLAFPTVQSCIEGENAWIELAAEGQDPHDLDAPAPTLLVTEAAAEHGHGHAEESADSADAEAAATQETASDAGPSLALAIAALIAGSLGLIVGIVALVRGRAKA